MHKHTHAVTQCSPKCPRSYRESLQYQHTLQRNLTLALVRRRHGHRRKTAPRIYTLRSFGYRTPSSSSTGNRPFSVLRIRPPSPRRRRRRSLDRYISRFLRQTPRWRLLRGRSWVVRRGEVARRGVVGQELVLRRAEAGEVREGAVWEGIVVGYGICTAAVARFAHQHKEDDDDGGYDDCNDDDDCAHRTRHAVTVRSENVGRSGGRRGRGCCSKYLRRHP